MKNFNIYLNDSSAVYFPGQSIQGVVQFYVDSKINTTGIPSLSFFLSRSLSLSLNLSFSYMVFLTHVEFSDDISILNQNIKYQIIPSHLNLY